MLPGKSVKDLQETNLHRMSSALFFPVCSVIYPSTAISKNLSHSSPNLAEFFFFFFGGEALLRMLQRSLDGHFEQHTNLRPSQLCDWAFCDNGERGERNAHGTESRLVAIHRQRGYGHHIWSHRYLKNSHEAVTENDGNGRLYDHSGTCHALASCVTKADSCKGTRESIFGL